MMKMRMRSVNLESGCVVLAASFYSSPPPLYSHDVVHLPLLGGLAGVTV